jgi:hypothetical protein
VGLRVRVFCSGAGSPGGFQHALKERFEAGETGCDYSGVAFGPISIIELVFGREV